MFIKTYKAVGAAFATIIAQAVVVAVQVAYVKNEIDTKNMLKMTHNYFLASVVMFAVCFITGYFMHNYTIITMILKAGIGIITYYIMLILLKDSYTKNLKGEIKNLIFKRQSE